MKSGPDVFADALVPLGTRSSLGDAIAPRSVPVADASAVRRRISPFIIDRSQGVGCFASALRRARHRPRTRYPPRGPLPDGGSSSAGLDSVLPRGAADRQATNDADTGLGGMVIVAPSRTVNRTSRLGFPAVPQAVLRFRVRRHGAHIYIPFIANLKLPFKFDRS